jgi:hypothetical protein
MLLVFYCGDKNLVEEKILIILVSETKKYRPFNKGQY